LEKTRAAVAKAKEHLDVAELLAEHGFFGQAYAHAALAVEEASVAGIRLLTESNVISWERPPPWFRVREKDLYLGGTHPMKLRIGLVTARVLPVLQSWRLSDSALDPGVLRNAIPERARELGEIVPGLRSDPVLSRFLLEGQTLKEDALYSTPKKPGALSAGPLNEEEYRQLVETVRPLVDSLARSIPEEEELSVVQPLLDALFLGDSNRAIAEFETLMRRALGGSSETGG
jgi:hypothetical protein